MTTGRINQITLRWRIFILSSRRAREREKQSATRRPIINKAARCFFTNTQNRERGVFFSHADAVASVAVLQTEATHARVSTVVSSAPWQGVPTNFLFSPRPCYHSSEAPTAIQFNSSRPACRRAQTARDTLHSFLLERGAKFLSQPTWQANETDKGGSLVRVARTLLESSSTRLANFF